MRRAVRWIAVALCATAAAGTCLGALEPNAGPYAAGFRVFRVPGDETYGPRIAAVWYPSTGREKPYDYPRRSNVVPAPRTRLAFEGEPARDREPYPLVIFAHGAYGCALDSAFLCEYLARHGFVVAATDYQDAGPPDFTQQIAVTRLGWGNLMSTVGGLFTKTAGLVRFMVFRPRQFLREYLELRRLAPTRALVDWLVKCNQQTGWPLAGMIDQERIGMVGHSLGGMTTLALIGAHPDDGQRDRRIKAAVLLSAPVYPFRGTVKNVAVPVLVMHGDKDPAATGRLAKRSMAYDRAPAPKFYVILRNATHFSFSNPRGVALSRCWRQDERAAAVCAYSERFFSRYLKGERADGLLSEPGEGVVYYAYTLAGQPEKRWGQLPEQPRLRGMSDYLKLWLQEGRRR